MGNEYLEAFEKIKQSVIQQEIDCFCGKKANGVGIFEPSEEFCKRNNVPVERTTFYAVCDSCSNNTKQIEIEIAKMWNEKRKAH